MPLFNKRNRNVGTTANTTTTRTHPVHHFRTVAYILFAILSIIVIGLSSDMHQRAQHYLRFGTVFGDELRIGYSRGFKNSTDAVIAWSVICCVYFVLGALFSLARVSVLISPLLDVICLTVLFIFGLGAMAATSHYGPESYPSVGKAMLGLGWLLDWLMFLWIIFTVIYTISAGVRWASSWHSQHGGATNTTYTDKGTHGLGHNAAAPGTTVDPVVGTHGTTGTGNVLGYNNTTGTGHTGIGHDNGLGNTGTGIGHNNGVTGIGHNDGLGHTGVGNTTGNFVTQPSAAHTAAPVYTADANNRV